MDRRKLLLPLGIAAVAILATGPRPAAELGALAIDAKAAFEQLKQLKGEWEAPAAGGKIARTQFELTANGTVLLERYTNDALPGGGRMATAYHLDGNDLVLTHYCIANNQPVLRAERFDPATREIQFEFLRAGNLSSPASRAHAPGHIPDRRRQPLRHRMGLLRERREEDDRNRNVYPSQVKDTRHAKVHAAASRRSIELRDAEPRRHSEGDREIHDLGQRGYARRASSPRAPSSPTSPDASCADKGPQMRVTDGPYSETKEVLGGYYTIVADSYEHAAKRAADCPHLEYRRDRSRSARSMPSDSHQLVDHLFRHQAGQMVAWLTRIFGPAHLELAEEVVQDALVKALQQWPFAGIPENPAGVAVRRRAQPARSTCSGATSAFADRAGAIAAELNVARNAVLRHPRGGQGRRAADGVHVLPPGTAAGCAGRTEPQDGRWLQHRRDRARVSDHASPPSLSASCGRNACCATGKSRSSSRTASTLSHRLDPVLEVIYLMFNEGYAAHAGEYARRDGSLPRSHPPRADWWPAPRSRGRPVRARAGRADGAARRTDPGADLGCRRDGAARGPGPCAVGRRTDGDRVRAPRTQRRRDAIARRITSRRRSQPSTPLRPPTTTPTGAAMLALYDELLTLNPSPDRCSEPSRGAGQRWRAPSAALRRSPSSKRSRRSRTTTCCRR